MDTVIGTSLGTEVFDSHKHVRDLIAYDGPLLSQFVSDQGDQFLYYWCESDGLHNRWMVLRVDESTIVRLANGMIFLDMVIPGSARDGYVYILDMDGEGITQSIKLTLPSNLPLSYRPKPGHVLRPEYMHPANESFEVLMDGSWSIENLRLFPEKFSNVYTLLYVTNVYPESHQEGYPWRGGFSVMHFRNWALSVIPKRARPRVAALSYASPGFIRFKLDLDTANSAAQCVRIYNTSKETIQTYYRALSQFIHDNSLNSIEDTYDELWSRYNRDLTDLARLLMQRFGPVKLASFQSTFQRPFEAAKVAMSFYRSVKELSEFEEQGLVTFPTNFQNIPD